MVLDKSVPDAALVIELGSLYSLDCPKNGGAFSLWAWGPKIQYFPEKWWSMTAAKKSENIREVNM